MKIKERKGWSICRLTDEEIKFINRLMDLREIHNAYSKHFYRPACVTCECGATARPISEQRYLSEFSQFHGGRFHPDFIKLAAFYVAQKFEAKHMLISNFKWLKIGPSYIKNLILLYSTKNIPEKKFIEEASKIPDSDFFQVADSLKSKMIPKIPLSMIIKYILNNQDKVDPCFIRYAFKLSDADFKEFIQKISALPAKPRIVDPIKINDYIQYDKLKAILEAFEWGYVNCWVIGRRK